MELKNNSFNAFEPFIDSKSNFIHFEYHYKKYIDNASALVETNAIFDNLSLENALIVSHKDINLRHTFNQISQAWNHEFWWKSLTSPNSIERNMSYNIKSNIELNFGNVENFYSKILEEGNKLFGSGWIWIVLNEKNNIDVIHTTNAFNPLLMEDLKPLLCIDVWEHAYYLQYNHKKSIFIREVSENLLNWHFAEKCFFSV